jgi:hypothetical protein
VFRRQRGISDPGETSTVAKRAQTAIGVSIGQPVGQFVGQ